MSLDATTNERKRIKVTRFNHHLFTNPEPETGLKSQIKKTKSNVFSQHFDSSRKSAISEHQFRKSNLCKKLDEDFESQMAQIKQIIQKKSIDHSSLRLGSALSKEALLDKSPLLPHGATHIDIFQDKLTYLSEKLETPVRSLYQEKTSNISKFCVPEKFESIYEKNIADYHNLYLECMIRKKEPFLTNILKVRNSVVETVTVNNDLNVFVKYNPDVKSR